MNDRIDRRAFLASAGSAGLTLAGCGSTQARLLRVARAPRTLQQAIRGHVFYPHHQGYLQAALVFNMRFDAVRPHAVARPVDTKDVAAAVKWLVGHGVPFRVRSGGHSYAGYSTLQGGVVLDLRRLRGITLDHATGIATIGAGAQLIDVYAALASQGATIPGGSCPSVGIAGVTLGGGQGLAARAFGLTCDHLVAAEIVTADGRIRHVDKHTDPDLLWALRGGGGGNFGVVTRFYFRVHRLPSIASDFFITWPSSSAAEAFDAWQRWAPHARDELTSIFHFDPGPSPSVDGQYLGPKSDLPGLLAPLTSVPGASLSFNSHDYLTLQLIWAGNNCSSIGLTACHTVGTRPGGTLPRHKFDARSDFVTHPISSQGIQTLIDQSSQPGAGTFLFDCYGGAINRVPPHKTAFVHRNALCCIQYYTEQGSAWLNSAHAAMRPYVSGQAYQNYIDPRITNWQHAYYGSNYPRLVAVQQRVDPQHRFNFPQAVGN